MHAGIQLVGREFVLLGLLSALGAAPAALLNRSLDGATRLALAPCFGLAVGLCSMMTLIWRVPANRSYWIVPVLALASITAAVWIGRRDRSERAARRGRWAIDRRSAVQLALVVIVVAGAHDRPLVQLNSTGPVTYAVADAAGYIAAQDGARTESIHGAKAAAAQTPPLLQADIAEAYWQAYSSSYQQIGFDALAANVNALLGLGASQTFAPFLIALMVVTALGVFAGVRVIAGGRPWAAVLGGVLVAGPFWIQLMMDGSEGAIAGLALLVPFAITGYQALRHRRWVDYVLFALVAAGMQTAYPLLVPPLAVGATAVLAVLAARRWVNGRLGRTALKHGLFAIGGVLLLAAALTPVAFERNLRYWHAVLAGHQSYVGLPAYSLPVGLLPSWLLQTRLLYVLPQSLSAGELVASVLVPLAMLAVIYVAVRSRPALLAGGAVIVVAALLAYFTMSRYQCSYCVDRNLLVVSPLALTMFAIGLAVLSASTQLGRRVWAVCVGVMALAAVGNQARITDLWVTHASWAFEPQTRAVLRHIPHLRPLALAMEGFGQTPKAALEDPAVYAAARYAAGGEPSLPTENSDNSGLFYMLGPRPAGNQFDPHYRLVLTRLAAIDSGRRMLYRDGPVALEQRSWPLDVLVTSGVQTALARTDPTGTAWIEGPLSMWVSATRTGEPVSIDVEADVTSSARVSRQPGMTVERNGSRLSVCAPVNGAGSFRRIAVDFTVSPVTQHVPRGSAVRDRAAGEGAAAGLAARRRACVRPDYWESSPIRCASVGIGGVTTGAIGASSTGKAACTSSGRVFSNSNVHWKLRTTGGMICVSVRPASAAVERTHSRS